MTVVQDLVDEVVSEGAFDASAASVLRWLNRRHRKMVVRSRCYRDTRSIGPTVSGTSSYALGDGVVEVLNVAVGGLTYTQAAETDFLTAAQGYLLIEGDGLMGASEIAGVRALQIYPVPETATTLTVHAVLVPPDLDVNVATTLRIPPDFQDALVAGAIATGLRRNPGDWRPDLAQGFEQEFTDGCEELRRQVNRRYRGAGPAQIRVKGLNA